MLQFFILADYLL